VGAAVVVENVSKSYGDVRALDGVSLTFAAGSFTALMGPSGCGKSTLLNLLGALDRPGSGRILVDGRDVSTLSDGERDVYRRRSAGTIFQFFNLLPTMTAAENVALPLLLDGVPARQAEERAARGLADVGLEGRAGAYPYELSGGQMQRVAVARALSLSPALVLADEPTGNLDSRIGAQVLELLVSLSTGRGITVVMATHSTEAASYAKAIVRLRDGVVV